MSKFRVSEIFGPTVQGEGRLVGMPCVFVRFAGCDYKCAWCDSLHAVLPEYVQETPFMQETDIVASIKLLTEDRGTKWVVFSGGNPALFKLDNLVHMLHHEGYRVMVETQGSLWKGWINECDDICVSPKPPSAKHTVTDPYELKRLLTGPGFAATHKIYLKVVVFNEADYEYAVTIHETLPYLPMFVSVGNSFPPPAAADIPETHPEMVVPEILTKMSWLMEKVATDRRMGTVRVLPQLHVLAWGNERGR